MRKSNYLWLLLVAVLLLPAQEMAADIIMCHLLIQDASKAADLFSKSAHVYLNFAEAEVTKHTNFIKNMDKEDLAFYKK